MRADRSAVNDPRGRTDALRNHRTVRRQNTIFNRGKGFLSLSLSARARRPSERMRPRESRCCTMRACSRCTRNRGNVRPRPPLPPPLLPSSSSSSPRSFHRVRTRKRLLQLFGSNAESVTNGSRWPRLISFCFFFSFPSFYRILLPAVAQARILRDCPRQQWYSDTECR